MKTAPRTFALLLTVAGMLAATGCEVRFGDARPASGSQAQSASGSPTPPTSSPQAALPTPPMALPLTVTRQVPTTSSTPTIGTATAGTSSATGTATAAAGQAVAPLAAPAAGIDVVRVYNAARPAVVNITTAIVSPADLSQPVEVPAGTGTGVIVDPRGYILTNSHVIQNPSGSGEAPSIRVSLADERTFDARVVDDDRGNDLAILQIEAPNLPSIRLGDSDRIQVGEPVVAIGFALALPGGPSVTSGVVSAVDRSIEEPNGVILPNLIQTDAAINPGNSGGPLLNASAEVIGINTAGSQRAQGISFAVAINQARPAVDSVIASGQVIRAFLGIQIVGAVTPAIARSNNLPVDRGVAVQAVAGGPAAQAGVRDGDIIVAIDGQVVRNPADVQNGIRKHKPGDQVRLSIARQAGSTVEVVATLIEAPR